MNRMDDVSALLNEGTCLSAMTANYINISIFQTSPFVKVFILWNNLALTNLRSLLHAVFHVLRGPRPLDAETPLLPLLQKMYPDI
jgi:hypothetical protein